LHRLGSAMFDCDGQRCEKNGALKGVMKELYCHI
jgi:hypothetical protein